MATEYTCITRKIEVHLHKHGDSEEATQRFKDEFRIWDDINNNLYKAANRIITHCFFNDAYEYRLKLHSPRLQEIEKLLSNSKRNKLSDEEVKQLKAERKQLFADFKKQRQVFLRGGVEAGAKRDSVHLLPTLYIKQLPLPSTILPIRGTLGRFQGVVFESDFSHTNFRTTVAYDKFTNNF